MSTDLGLSMMLTLAEEIEASVAAQRLHLALLTALAAVDNVTIWVDVR